MEFLKTHKLDARRVLIFSGVMLGSLLLLSVLMSTLRPFSRGGYVGGNAIPVAYSPTPEYYDSKASPEYTISVRNMEPMMPGSMPPVYSGYTSGDSEAFEVKNYSAFIETNDLARDCTVVADLKSRSEVVFENASTYDHGCSFSFKVEKGSVEQVLTVLRSLDPKELNEQAYTIKREVDDYTSEIDILTKKLTALDAAYAEAVASYTSITEMATKSGDIENLAKIIESKLVLIERLTSSRLQVAAELERMERAKAESLDRLVYTYFTVGVTERVFVDGTSLADSWKSAIESAVREINRILQNATVGLVVFSFGLFTFILYAFIVLLAVRFGWQYVRKTWNEARGGGTE